MSLNVPIALLALFTTPCLIILWLIALHNARRFPRLPSVPTGVEQQARPVQPPLHVAVLIPARNEAKIIAHAIGDLLAQDYPSYELHILDDQSHDNTFSAAQAAAQDNLRAHVWAGTPLPAGWLGKHWACHQLAHAASADLLLFADADVRWQPTTLTALVTHRRATNADLLTAWPRQITITWAERLVVPLMSFVLLAYLPISWAHDRSKKSAVAANGQCMLFTRAAYTQIGGHRAVRAQVLDDIALAYAVKQHGLRLRMVDGGPSLTCRMYHNWQSVSAGFSKNILAAHANSPLLLIISLLLHTLCFIFPLAWLILALTSGEWLAAIGSAVLLLLGIGVRALTAHIAGLRLRDALWMPLSILLLDVIGCGALWHHWRHGGPRWKNRHIPARQGNCDGN